MSNAVTTTENKQTQQLTPVQKAKAFFSGASIKAQIQAALPSHIDLEKFVRILQTALNQNEKLATANFDSLITAALKCAADGLLPDGREAALVTFFDKRVQMDMVQYMPMYEGILKKMRNSGELLSIEANVVYKGDKFQYRPGVDEVPIFEPDWFGDRGEKVGAYAVGKLKSGGLYVEIMSATQILATKKVSRSAGTAFSPWNGDFEEEMWKKAVTRRISKRMPKSTDLEQTLQNDDETYELPGKSSQPQIAAPETRPALTAPSNNDEVVVVEEPKTVKKPSRAEQAMGIKPNEPQPKEEKPVVRTVKNHAPGAVNQSEINVAKGNHTPASVIEAEFSQASDSGRAEQATETINFYEDDGESPI